MYGIRLPSDDFGSRCRSIASVSGESTTRTAKSAADASFRGAADSFGAGGSIERHACPAYFDALETQKSSLPATPTPTRKRASERPNAPIPV
jgi:hypothetical protein